MSVDGNLMLSNSQASLPRCHCSGCVVDCSAQPYFKTSFEPTYLGVEPKDKNLALVVSKAFPRNCFQAPRQKRAPPRADIGDTTSAPGLAKRRGGIVLCRKQHSRFVFYQLLKPEFKFSSHPYSCDLQQLKKNSKESASPVTPFSATKYKKCKQRLRLVGRTFKKIYEDKPGQSHLQGNTAYELDLVTARMEEINYEQLRGGLTGHSQRKWWLMLYEMQADFFSVLLLFAHALAPVQ